MQHIAIYYRVSTDKQDFASQRNTIEQWLEELPESKQPKSVKVFKDEGISGKTLNRPGFQALLKDAFQKKFDTILVYRLDRLSRHANHAIKILLELDEVGVGFISVTQPVLNLGHENPFRRTMLSAFAELAEIERETIVARVKAGLAAAKKRGQKLGAPMKVDAKKQHLARELRDNGLSYKKIAAELKLSVGAVHKLVKGADLPPADRGENHG